MGRWCGGVEECLNWPEGFRRLRFLARKEDDGPDRIAVKDSRRNKITAETDERKNLPTCIDLTTCRVSTVVLVAKATVSLSKMISQGLSESAMDSSIR